MSTATDTYHHDTRRPCDRHRCARMAVFDRHGVELRGIQAVRVVAGGLVVRVWIQPGVFAPDDDPVDAFVPGGYVRYTGESVPEHDPWGSEVWAATKSFLILTACGLLLFAAVTLSH